MPSNLSLSELDDRIAVLRGNIRQLIEQAAAASGGQNEERTADRIAQQTAELDRLVAARRSDPNPRIGHFLRKNARLPRPNPLLAPFSGPGRNNSPTRRNHFGLPRNHPETVAGASSRLRIRRKGDRGDFR